MTIPSIGGRYCSITMVEGGNALVLLLMIAKIATARIRWMEVQAAWTVVQTINGALPGGSLGALPQSFSAVLIDVFELLEGYPPRVRVRTREITPDPDLPSLLQRHRLPFEHFRSYGHGGSDKSAKHDNVIMRLILRLVPPSVLFGRTKRSFYSMALPFSLERQFALAAVRRACVLTDSVFNKLVTKDTLTKGDQSPVTGKTSIWLRLALPSNIIFIVGDYAAQALIASMLSHAFPEDKIVGEEDASDLRVDSGKILRERIVELGNAALVSDLQLGDVDTWGIGPGKEQTSDQLLNAIDRGNHQGGSTGRKDLFRSNLTSLCLNYQTQGCGQLTPSMELRASFGVVNTLFAWP